MKKILLALFSLIFLCLGLMFANIGITSFGEMGRYGGMLVLGKLVVTNFIKNDFSLWILIISSLTSLCFVVLSILIFPPLKKNKNAVVL